MKRKIRLPPIECVGVFQGGGAKAAAHAGAYQFVHESGVRLSAVAGTSAGSIIAALVGAGATPADINRSLETMDFSKLIQPPVVMPILTSSWTRFFGWLLSRANWASKYVGATGKMLRYGGLYSSAGIESWLNEQLLVLLPDCRERVVQFRHLKMDVHVIATDLATGTHRVWNRKSTPDDSVALAVRASCSIPFFFQPVVNGQHLLVDGGVISNLPSFVFANGPTTHSHRVLAFCLSESKAIPKQWSLESFGMQLLDAAIQGATSVQLSLQPNVRGMDILTAGISSTDFSSLHRERSKLVEFGRDAAQKFFESQEVNWLRAAPRPDLRDRDQVYLAVVRERLSAGDEVVISEQDTDWYWQLFPTVLCWRLNGVRVRLLLPRSLPLDRKQRQREVTRRANIGGLGVQVHEVDDLPVHAYAFSKADGAVRTAIVLNASKNAHGPLGFHYAGDEHLSVATMTYDALIRLLPADTDLRPLPKLERMDDSAVCRLLKRGVEQYRAEHVSLAVEDVPVEFVKSITKIVRRYKYEQILRLAEVFEQNEIPPFGPCHVVLSNGENSVLAPPVFEEHGKVLVGVEGNTRTMYAHVHAIVSVRAVVVRGVIARLPGESVAVVEMVTAEDDRETQERMPGFDYSQFRRIEGACHPLKTEL